MPPPGRRRVGGKLKATAQPRATAIRREGGQIKPSSPEPEEEQTKKKVVTPFQFEPNTPIEDRWKNLLIYGPYGHGKTTLATSADDVPEMRDVAFVNADSGTMSIISRRSMDFINLNSYKQAARVFDFFALHCRLRDEGNVAEMLKLEKRYKSNIIDVKYQTLPVEEGRTWFVEQRLRTGKPMDEPYIYRTAILDSLSEIYRYMIYKYLGVDIGKTKVDDDIETMDEWPAAQEQFRLFIRSWRDLPMNVIFVSGESIEPDMKNKRRNPRAGQALPRMAGQAATDVVGFIDIVGYLVREIDKEGEQQRYLYLGAGYEGWISKHRFENLPDLEYVTNPTMTSLIDLARKDAEYGTSDTEDSDEEVGALSSGSNGHAKPSQRRSQAHSPSSRRRGRDDDNRVRRRRVRR